MARKQVAPSQVLLSYLTSKQVHLSQMKNKLRKRRRASNKTNSVGPEELSWLADFATIVKQRNLKELEKTLPKETLELLKKVWAVQRKIAGEMEQLTKKNIVNGNEREWLNERDE